MSTFSSVIHKSGKKFAPKATPRRNAQRSQLQSDAAQARVHPSSPTQDASPGTDSEITPNDLGTLPINSSSTLTSNTASASSLASAINTRSTSLETDLSNVPRAPDPTVLNTESNVGSRVESNTSSLNETTLDSSREDNIRASHSQPPQPPPVRSSVPQQVKRKQVETDTADGAKTASAGVTGSSRSPLM